jgi:DNA-binding NtrC family response regulator
VRVVAISGLSSNEQVARSAGPQVVAFLHKPFTATALVTTVQHAVAVSQGATADGGGTVRVSLA